MAHEIRSVLRLPQVKSITTFSEMQIWRLEQAGKFPRRFKLCEDGRAVGWFADEIAQYQAERAASRKPMGCVKTPA